MTPETILFLAKAKQLVAEAEAMLLIELNNAAGRTAYLAAFHTAQALISEREGRTIKTHKGVHIEFQRLTKDDAKIPAETRAFLSQAYNLKAIADYETGLGSDIPRDQAIMAVAKAARFLSYFSKHLSDAEAGPV